MARKEIDPNRIRELHALKAHFREELFANPDVTSVGIGFRERNGERTDDVCLVVTVSRKLPEEDVAPSRLLPRELSFFSRAFAKEIAAEIDVQESGVAEMYDCGSCGTDLDARVRPVPGGFNIGGASGGGTLGGWVWDELNDEVVLISNNHVLGGTVGSNIIQPGSSGLADKIAEVVRTGTLDATIGAPTGSGIVDASIECSGPAVFEVTDPQLDMKVEKVGQTTSLTCGTVTAIGVDRGHYGSTNDFRVDTDDPDVRFAYYGDSGSLIVERTHPQGRNWKRVVGLLWGGIPSEYNAFGHPIEDVFADLDLTTVCAGLVSLVIDGLFSSDTSFAAAPTFDIGGRGRMMRRSARRIEKRVRDTDSGAAFADLLDEHRAEVIGLLLDSDGWRATVAALHPILADKVTSTEALQHRITEEDVANVDRLVALVQERRPELEPFVGLAQKVLEKAEGRPIQEILGGSKSRGRKKPSKGSTRNPTKGKR